MSINRVLKIIRILLIVQCFLFFGCKDSKKQNTTTVINSTKIELKGDFCYKNETSSDVIIEGQKLIDVEELIININDGIVTGIYNYLPAEKDQRIGNLNGIVTNNVVFAKYIYSQEGEEITTYIKITLNDQEAIVEPDDSTHDMISKITKIKCN